ncbi:hypothetical protein JCM14036_02800 [Desulfotomaculum defluvii]
MPSSAQLKGYHRDRRILQQIEKLKALTTDQIFALNFEGENGQRKARERLLKLYQRKQVKRCRYSLNDPYCYYVGRKHGRLEHLLDLNWVYVWLVKKLKSWDVLEHFYHEFPLKILQPDALAGITNTITKKTNFTFVELDRSDNDFDKVVKYNRWYESDGYTSQWWSELADRFPTILVVTTSARRRAQILERIEKENTNGLEFKVMLLEEVKGEC